MNDRDGLLPDGVASAVDPGNQDEPARDTLPLNGHLVISVLRSPPYLGIEQYRNMMPSVRGDRNGLFHVPRGRPLE